MSASSIQRKLNKAYGKVGKKLGFDSDIYRVSQSYDTPINTHNWIYNTKAAFSQDGRFSAPVGSNVWLAWIDASLDNTFDLRVGDIVVDRETNRIYYIIDMHPLHPYRALETNTFVTIESKTEYSETDGEWGQSQTKVVTNVPAWVDISGSTSIDGGFVPARTSYGQFSDQYNIQMWLSEGEVRPNDTIILRDNTKLTVTTAMWDIRGYKIAAVVEE